MELIHTKDNGNIYLFLDSESFFHLVEQSKKTTQLLRTLYDFLCDKDKSHRSSCVMDRVMEFEYCTFKLEDYAKDFNFWITKKCGKVVIINKNTNLAPLKLQLSQTMDTNQENSDTKKYDFEDILASEEKYYGYCMEEGVPNEPCYNETTLFADGSGLLTMIGQNKSLAMRFITVLKRTVIMTYSFLKKLNKKLATPGEFLQMETQIRVLVNMMKNFKCQDIFYSKTKNVCAE